MEAKKGKRSISPSLFSSWTLRQDVKTSLLANPTRSESVTGKNIFQLFEDELKSCTPSCNCFDFILSRRPKKKKNVTDRSAFVTDKFSFCY